MTRSFKSHSGSFQNSQMTWSFAITGVRGPLQKLYSEIGIVNFSYINSITIQDSFTGSKELLFDEFQVQFQFHCMIYIYRCMKNMNFININLLKEAHRSKFKSYKVLLLQYCLLEKGCLIM